MTTPVAKNSGMGIDPPQESRSQAACLPQSLLPFCAGPLRFASNWRGDTAPHVVGDSLLTFDRRLLTVVQDRMALDPSTFEVGRGR